ncbi:putative hydro-lyase [Dinoroseobacter sp. PD6]|uniref:putative hydro-lyase n=1 Tax=Dinoroseobacter sp. PD6 TaxID=3028384 RepID=UPI00237AA516|nr:putative hydro-lyase [Dinoroseobacter sp. PD6]MDD9717563.1 putative hydro-lyase [Dinoroseobacter sp. PD6]
MHSSVPAEIRSGQHQGHTAGLAPGCLQVNLVVLPASHAQAFGEYCALNPRPCLLILLTTPGQTDWTELGTGLDVRRDVPAYNIYENGVLSRTVPDLLNDWSDDLVTFALGFSFTFEHALLRAGIPVRNIATNTTVPMYQTNRETRSAGPFAGPLVVSMRPIPAAKVAKAHDISAQFPWARGAPIHSGDPKVLGIEDLDQPDWGDTSETRDGGVPVFWACGVTPQAALEEAELSLCITHRPGHMLVTDLPEHDPFRAGNLQ